MSTKASLFLTEDDEHWYHECIESDNNHNRIYIEIDPKNIKFFQKDDQGVIIGLRGDSELVKILGGVKYDNS